MHSFIWATLCVGLGAAAGPGTSWSVVRRADPASPITLHLTLNLPDTARSLEQVVSEVSEPDHPRFRLYLTAEELQDALQPPAQHVNEVAAWLEQHGVDVVDQRGHVIEASMNVSQADQLLNAKYCVYSDGTRETIRTESYHIPEHLRNYVLSVSPTTTFPCRSKPRPAHTGSDESPSLTKRTGCGSDDNTTPDCIRQIYNITYTAQPNRTTFAVYATEAASYSASDMQKYLEQYNPAAALANAAFEVVGSGDPSEGLPGIEGAFETHLDTQASLGLAWPAQGILYNLGGVFGPKPGVTYDPFVRFLQDLIHNETVPSVVSFSESMPEDQVDPAYARSLCDMMAQIGTRGVTLVFSSGNNGPQGDQPTGTHKAIFEPEFPASCPYVLAVGGTTNLADETAATQSTITGAIAKLSYTASGGGFSNLFPFPDYQQPDQPIYMRDHVPVSYRSLSGYSSNGRGIPDVSAFSTNFPVVYNGATVPISGTSAAAPTWAAVIALLNDYEASKCRPPLGFVNPWLYKYASSGILKDITTGGNNSGKCDQLSGCSLSQTPGYDVTPGWDAVTGLGSPIVSAMIEILDRQPC